METATLPENLELIASLDIQAEAVGAKKGASRFSIVANSGEPMTIAGWPYPVVIELKGVRFDRNPTPVVMDHNTGKRIGHTTYQGISRGAITAEGVVSSTSPEAVAFVADSKNGYPFQCSVGAIIEDSEEIPQGESIVVNGKTHQGPLIVARKTNIRELSVTVLGADGSTSAAITASKSHNSPIKKGNSMSTLLSKFFTRTPAAPTHEVENAVSAERARIDQINAMLLPPETESRWNNVSQELETLRASAVKGEVSLSELPSYVRQLHELQDLRASRTTFNPSYADSANHNSFRGGNAQVLEAALASYVGVANLEKHYGEQTLEASKRLGITCMMDVAKFVAQTSGREYSSRSKDSVLQAAFSTADFATLLSNVANKSLLEAYNSFPSAAKLIAKKLSANDFKTATGIRMTGDVTFLKVAGDGEIKHGSLADWKYNYRIETYAKMFGLDRQSIINDDLNALSSMPQLLARGANLAIEETFWTLVLANTGSFFSTDNGNFISGSDSALAAPGLSTAVQKFLEQKDTQGKPISSLPRFLCTPPALKTTADELYTSRTFNTGAGSTADRVPSSNAFFGLYQPVVSPWLGATSGLSGVSNSAWYLFGDPRDIAAFGLAYLSGTELPTIEETPMTGNKLGVSWRGYLDFGVCQIDPRGAVKSAGA